MRQDSAADVVEENLNTKLHSHKATLDASLCEVRHREFQSDLGSGKEEKKMMCGSRKRSAAPHVGVRRQNFTTTSTNPQENQSSQQGHLGSKRRTSLVCL